MSHPQNQNADELAARLERGEVIYFPQCPFALPLGEDLHFLLAQTLGGRRHKNISYDPAIDRAAGFRWRDEQQAERIRRTLAEFAGHAATWLGSVTPRYAAGWQRDRASFRPEEEATRRLRQRARNDLLHIDAFPTRPTGGGRLLRLFANIHPAEERVWVTAETFPLLLERFGPQVGFPGKRRSGWARRMGRAVLRLVDRRPERTAYDDFMLRLHHVMKADYRFQEKGGRRFWKFAPGSAWLAFTDGISHAVLRGQFALEHTFVVPVGSLAEPALSPVKLFEGAVRSQAA